ncbi:MAG: KH domain-containing protein [Candidatus Bathyarchaeia archaeon]|nr:RNA-processing protein [Candidatus Bathyarchaeota archaeon]
MNNRLSFNIPRERVGVLIGRGGRVKEHIEESLRVNLKVDGSLGAVEVEGSDSNPMSVWRARDVVLAIGRGFPPEKAFKLLSSDEYLLDVMDLRSILGRSENAIRRVKGRIIGREGKTRRIIEEVAGVDISVYGHTVSIIGLYENIVIARDAIKMLIEGKTHATVYRFLSERRRELKKLSKTKLWE